MIDKKQAIFTITYLLVVFSLFALIAMRYEHSPIKWFITIGFVIYLIGAVGKYLSSGKEKAVDLFIISSKVGLIISAVGVALKGIIIIKQREVYVASGYVKNNEAIVQGVFLLFLAVMLTVFIVKYID